MVLLFFYYRIDVGIVASEAVIVQPVTYDEVVGDVHGNVFDVEVYLQFVGFHQQGGDMYLLRVAGTERFEQTLHGKARIYDVFYDDYRTMKMA